MRSRQTSSLRPLLSLMVGAAFLFWSALTLSAQVGMGGYAGAASRTNSPTLPTGTLGDATSGWRPWIFVNGIFTDTLAPDTTSISKPITSHGTWGTSLGWGLSGYQRWSRTTLALTYMGSFNYYNRADAISRQNHVLTLGVEHQLSSRLSVSLSQLAGTSTGGFGLGAGMTGFGVPGGFGLIGLPGSFYDQTANGIVDNESLDSQSYFLSSRGSLNYRLSETWSLSGGGGGFFVRRHTPFIDVNGATAYASASQRLNSRAAITYYGAQSWFSYPNLFGNNSATSGGLGFEYAFSPRTRMSLSGGIWRYNSKYVAEVPLDPILAFILGTTTGFKIQEIHRTSFLGTGNITHNFKVGAAYAFYFHGLVPATDILLASVRDLAGTAYGLPIGSRWDLSALLSFARNSGIVQGGSYSSYQVAGRASYRIARGFHSSLSLGYRYVDFGPTSRRQRYISLGLGWSPGEQPLPF